MLPHCIVCPAGYAAPLYCVSGRYVRRSLAAAGAESNSGKFLPVSAPAKGQGRRRVCAVHPDRPPALMQVPIIRIIFRNSASCFYFMAHEYLLKAQFLPAYSKRRYSCSEISPLAFSYVETRHIKVLSKIDEWKPPVGGWY